MAVLARIMMMILAYILASIAAAIVLDIGILTPEWNDYVWFAHEASAHWPVILGLGAAIIAVMTALPALLVIALGEGLALRSSLYYGALGGALALSLTYGFNVAGYVGEPSSFDAHQRGVLAGAGIAGGFVYWLFAGRNAGSWKR